jgi:antiviral helicase SLH1
MKALASEIVRKLGKRLRWLFIEVRELTGMFMSVSWKQ